MSDLITTTASIDIEAIRNRRKQAWMTEAKKHMSVQEKIAVTVPWWLVIIGAGLFALSAGHTIGVFNRLSSLGYAGPFVVEFSLLWAAFARVMAKQQGTTISKIFRALELITFIMAIVANGIGATDMVTKQASVQSLSASSLIQQFGTLALTVQLDMFFVPLFAFFVPIGTWVVGEGLAKLILDGRRTGSHLDQSWGEVEQEEIRRALFAEYLRRGVSHQEAKRQAEAVSASMVRGRVRTLPLVQADIKQLSAKVDSGQPMDGADTRNGRRADARFVVRRYLESNPDAARMSARELARRLGISKTIAAEERLAHKTKQNGHSQPG